MNKDIKGTKSQWYPSEIHAMYIWLPVFKVCNGT